MGLIEKFLESEGKMVPFCPNCNAFRFPLYNVCCSMIVMNRAKDHIVLIKQYGGEEYLLVAGYVNQGESAEETVVREIKEELGMSVKKLKYNKSEYFTQNEYTDAQFRRYCRRDFFRRHCAG